MEHRDMITAAGKDELGCLSAKACKCRGDERSQMQNKVQGCCDDSPHTTTTAHVRVCRGTEETCNWLVLTHVIRRPFGMRRATAGALSIMKSVGHPPVPRAIATGHWIRGSCSKVSSDKYAARHQVRSRLHIHQELLLPTCCGDKGVLVLRDGCSV